MEENTTQETKNAKIPEKVEKVNKRLFIRDETIKTKMKNREITKNVFKITDIKRPAPEEEENRPKSNKRRKTMVSSFYEDYFNMVDKMLDNQELSNVYYQDNKQIIDLVGNLMKEENLNELSICHNHVRFFESMRSLLLKANEKKLEYSDLKKILNKEYKNGHHCDINYIMETIILKLDDDQRIIKNSIDNNNETNEKKKELTQIGSIENIYKKIANAGDAVSFFNEYEEKEDWVKSLKNKMMEETGVKDILFIGDTKKNNTFFNSVACFDIARDKEQKTYSLAFGKLRAVYKDSNGVDKEIKIIGDNTLFAENKIKKTISGLKGEFIQIYGNFNIPKDVILYNDPTCFICDKKKYSLLIINDFDYVNYINPKLPTNIPIFIVMNNLNDINMHFERFIFFAKSRINYSNFLRILNNICFISETQLENIFSYSFLFTKEKIYANKYNILSEKFFGFHFMFTEYEESNKNILDEFLEDIQKIVMDDNSMIQRINKVSKEYEDWKISDRYFEEILVTFGIKICETIQKHVSEKTEKVSNPKKNIKFNRFYNFLKASTNNFIKELKSSKKIKDLRNEKIEYSNEKMIKLMKETIFEKIYFYIGYNKKIEKERKIEAEALIFHTVCTPLAKQNFPKNESMKIYNHEISFYQLSKSLDFNFIPKEYKIEVTTKKNEHNFVTFNENLFSVNIEKESIKILQKNVLIVYLDEKYNLDMLINIENTSYNIFYITSSENLGYYENYFKNTEKGDYKKSFIVIKENPNIYYYLNLSKCLMRYLGVDNYWTIFPNELNIILHDKMNQKNSETTLKNAMKKIEYYYTTIRDYITIDIKIFIKSKLIQLSNIYEDLVPYFENVDKLDNEELRNLIICMKNYNKPKFRNIFSNQERQKILENKMKLNDPVEEISKKYNFLEDCQMIKIINDTNKDIFSFSNKLMVDSSMNKSDIVYHCELSKNKIIFGDFGNLTEKEEKESSFKIFNMNRIYFSTNFYNNP